ncbi:KRAB-A domain-containing protein 2-like [Diorhabda carinulata]|uniref:KRAB-A domain-containing protein 2-like n=1 Tax=Diorhabda carinulata TaxID=1163345 RepID=UPI0025A03E1A|nr:KRAB-A domain-containing protein 2-like [Diorhabda carinulata]
MVVEALKRLPHIALGVLILKNSVILQSGNGGEFSIHVISKRCVRWKDVKLVHGNPPHSKILGSAGRANQDIMVTAWMKDNDTKKWSEGLHIVQFSKNTTYHEKICQNPYEVMFGIKAKRGKVSSFLLKEQITNMKTEEQLEKIANTFKPKNGLNKLII